MGKFKEIAAEGDTAAVVESFNDDYPFSGELSSPELDSLRAQILGSELRGLANFLSDLLYKERYYGRPFERESLTHVIEELDRIIQDLA